MNNNLFELKESYKQAYFDTAKHPSVVVTEAIPFSIVSIRKSPLIKKHNVIVKRMLDLIISAIVTVLLLSWLLPILALLIKMDSRGPIFFVQKRNKKNGKFFYCLKLRTMIVNTDADTLTAVINDHRITTLGKFLRKSHLDELPQFINVLLGDMSLIGPRPHMFIENIKYKAMFNSYHQRQAVKPGITGLAQSLGYHGPITDRCQLEKKIEYDLFYINNWTLLLDVKILVKTINVIYKKII
jgi:putative colanic acid biosynthesis UDP-glucose lipid carrier transferase